MDVSLGMQKEGPAEGADAAARRCMPPLGQPLMRGHAARRYLCILTIHGGCNACKREVLAVDAPGAGPLAVPDGGQHGHTTVRHSGQLVWGTVCGFQTVR